MNLKKIAAYGLVSSITLSSPVSAQSGPEYHPYLTDTFMIGVGAFFPTNGLSLSANGYLPDDEIDFGATLGVDDSQVTPAVDFRWNFGEKWSLGGAMVESGLEWL